MNPEELWRRALIALHAGHSPAQVNAWLAAHSPYPTMDHLSAALRASDLQDATRATSPAAETAMAFGHGATVGTSPYLGAAFDALTTLKGQMDAGRPLTNPLDEFRASLAGQKATLADFAAAHPAASTAANIAGGVGTGLLSVPLAAGAEGAPTLWQLIRSGLTTGAVAGGVQGAADAPDLASAPGEALRGAVTGGAGGAVLGAAAKPAMAGAAFLGRGLRALLAPGADATATATGILSKNLSPEALALLQTLRGARPNETMVADVLPSVLDQARMQSAGVDRAAAEALASRNAGAGDRAAQDLVTGTTGTPTVSATEAEQAARDALAYKTGPVSRRLYAPLDAAYPEVAPGPPERDALYEMVQGNPIVRQTLTGVMQEMSPEEIATGATGQIPQQARDLPSPSFQQLQTVHRMLQDRAGRFFASGSAQAGADAKALAAQFGSALEQAVPGYRLANSGFAMSKRVLEAFDQGRQALHQTPEQITQDLQKLAGNPDAQSAYRMGAIDQHAQMLQGLTPEANAFRAAMQSGNQSIAKRLGALFNNDPSVLDQFLQGTQAEQYFRRTAMASGNSATAGRQALAKQMFGDPMSSGSGGLTSRLLSFFSNAAAEGRPERIANALGPDLLAQGPVIDQVLQKVAAARAVSDATARRLRMGVRAAAMAKPLRRGSLMGSALAAEPLLDQLFGH